MVEASQHSWTSQLSGRSEPGHRGDPGFRGRLPSPPGGDRLLLAHRRLRDRARSRRDEPAADTHRHGGRVYAAPAELLRSRVRGAGVRIMEVGLPDRLAGTVRDAEGCGDRSARSGARTPRCSRGLGECATAAGRGRQDRACSGRPRRSVDRRRSCPRPTTCATSWPSAPISSRAAEGRPSAGRKRPASWPGGGSVAPLPSTWTSTSVGSSGLRRPTSSTDPAARQLHAAASAGHPRSARKWSSVSWSRCAGSPPRTPRSGAAAGWPWLGRWSRSRHPGTLIISSPIDVARDSPVDGAGRGAEGRSSP